MKHTLTNMKVRSKIMTMVIPTIVLVLMLGIVSLIFLSQVNGVVTEFAENVVPSVIAAEELDTTTSNYRITEYKHVVSENVDDMKEYEASLKEYETGVQSLLEQYGGVANEEKDRQIAQTLQDNWNKYLEINKQVLALSSELKTDEASKLLNAESLDTFQALSDDCKQLVEYNKEYGDSQNTVADRVYGMALGILVVCIIIIMVILIVLALLITRNLVAPIKELEQIAAAIAAENMDQKVSYQSKDELGAVSRNFNRIVERLETYMAYIDEIAEVLQTLASGQLYFELRNDYTGKFEKVKKALVDIRDSFNETIYQIGEASEQVALGSQQMAENAQGLAEGATEQAGAVEELMATIQDVASVAQTSASKAREAFEQAREFEVEAENGNHSMEELNAAMSSINETSQKIENIISEIEDIASQTNLLSLNASIEAARAGEAGRGFAVVADQIGKLASDSAKSAVNTRELIGQSIEEINNGNTITKKTSDALKKVIDGIRLLAQSSQETSEMSSNQADSLKQIEEGVEQISSVVQNNSASAEETSATSEELSAQSENLKALVDQFQLMDR